MGENKVMQVKRRIVGKLKGKGHGEVEKGIRKSSRRDEYHWNTVYAYTEVSEWSYLICTISYSLKKGNLANVKNLNGLMRRVQVGRDFDKHLREKCLLVLFK